MKTGTYSFFAYVFYIHFDSAQLSVDHKCNKAKMRRQAVAERLSSFGRCGCLGPKRRPQKNS